MKKERLILVLLFLMSVHNGFAQADNVITNDTFWKATNGPYIYKYRHGGYVAAGHPRWRCQLLFS